MSRRISRRKFINDTTCASMGYATLFSSLMNLKAIKSLASSTSGATGDYKAMVCILLAGGADSFNMLVPTETSEYSTYQNSRGILALDKNNPSDLVPLNYDDNGRTFSVHGAMPEVRDLFDNGDLSFVSNIGTLIEPVANRSEFESGLKKLPLGLYSHSDQIMQWQTSVPQSRSAVGVAGRIADIINDMNDEPDISMNISLRGKNRFQAGNTVNEFSLSNNSDDTNLGFTNLPYWQQANGYLNLRKNRGIDTLATNNYANVFNKTIGELTHKTIQLNDFFTTAFKKQIPLVTSFSNSNLSRDLKKIAEVISLKQHLGAKRQIFYTTIGGWDDHGNLLSAQNARLPQVSMALSEFNAAMEELGMKDDVVTFTISDFGRTLTSNNDGSDHAYGGNNMIMGGSILGGQIFGNYPSLDLNSDLNLSVRGRLLPTTSVDEFYAELALWFGVSPNDLDYILPNLCNFYSTSGCPASLPTDYMPIGMFS